MSDRTQELSRDVELPVVGSLATIPGGVQVERELAATIENE